MNFAQITSAMKNHQTAAQIIRYAGFSAKCVKNTECEQPYQVNVKCTSEEAKQLQIQMCKMLKDDTINIVCA